MAMLVPFVAHVSASSDKLASCMASIAISGYKLLEILGEGPRATVYKARDSKSQSWVAVKLFHAIDLQDAEKLLRLKHPHIATTFDVGSTGSQSFAITE